MIINTSSVNNILKVPNDSTIGGFRQTYNSFISKLKDSSIDDIFVNPSMRHIMASPSQVPFEWNITPEEAVATTDFVTSTTGPTQIRFAYIAGVTSQSVYQVISQRLKSNTEYTLAYTIEADANCEVSIQSPLCGLIDLRDNNFEATVLENSYTPTAVDSEYTDYFNFVTPLGLDQIEFHITNTSTIQPVVPLNPNNIIKVVNLYLFEGAVEFTKGVVRDNFLTNTKYENGTWQITNDGSTYRPLLTAGSVKVKYVGGAWQISNDGLIYRPLVAADGVSTTGMPMDGTSTAVMTVNIDGKIDATVFYEEHDEFGQHKSFNVVDELYDIGYRVKITDRSLSLVDPTVYSITPTLGPWNSAVRYYAGDPLVTGDGDVVTYQNLKWRCRLGDDLNNNTNKDPEVFSTDWWEEIPFGIVYPIDDSFPTHIAEFHMNHIQTADGFNGTHAIVDAAVPTNRYAITGAGTTPTLTLVTGFGLLDLSGIRLSTAFTVQHDGIGEHIFSISGVDKKLQLVVAPVTGIKTLSFVPYTRNPTAVTPTTFSDTFTNTTATVFHAVDGRHIIRDTDGLLWSMTVSGGAFVFTPYIEDTAIQTAFDLFRQEHDKYGRHVLRDTATGVFYHMFAELDGGLYKIKTAQTVFEPMNDITQFLAVYNVEHDIAARHMFRKQNYTGAYHLIFADAIVGSTNYTLTSEAPLASQTHQNNIANEVGGYHRPVEGATHKFYITNGVFHCNP